MHNILAYKNKEHPQDQIHQSEYSLKTRRFLRTGVNLNMDFLSIDAMFT